MTKLRENPPVVTPGGGSPSPRFYRQQKPRRWNKLAPLLVIMVLMALAPLRAPAAQEAAAPAPNLFSQVVEQKLKNGLTVLMLREPRAPLISLQVWYRVGSRNECLGKTGISHLTEHMMFRGTAKYAAGVFSREVHKAGGSENAFTGRNYTAFFETGSKSELKRWLEMEADRMKGLNVAEAAFETEKKVVLEERRLRTEDDPTSFLQEATMAATFEAHPYQWPVIGWFHDIESISRDDFMNYYHRYYQPNNCTLVIVGDIDPKEALSQVEATFGDLTAGPEPPQVTAKEPKQFGERRVEVRREAQMPFVLLAYHAPNWQSPDSYALELLAQVLAAGRSSRLYHRLIYKDRLALDVGADYDLDTTDPFVFLLYGQPLPGKSVAQVQAATEAEVKGLQTELVGTRELTKAKNQFTAQFYMGLDSLFFRGMLLGKFATVANWTLLKDLVAKVQAVTAEDLRRVARQYLVAENRTVGILVPQPSGKAKATAPFRPGGQVQ